MPCAVCPLILSTLHSPVSRAPFSFVAGTGENSAEAGIVLRVACWLIQSVAVVAGRPQPANSNAHIKVSAYVVLLGIMRACKWAALGSGPPPADPRCVRRQVPA